jgi:ectoine hydroxylase-related dioxygenase (phytanoyl-CoA dioxygenase family)
MENYTPFIVSNDALDNPARLKSSMDENGYLFLRDVAPKDALLGLRRDILELCNEAGWLDPSADLMDGLWSGAGPYTEGAPEYMAVYRKVSHLPSFADVPAHPQIMELLGPITGDPVLLHRRHIGRMTFPHNVDQTIAAHQDWHYIRGTTQTYTMWMPLGDCPMELGGLAVLRGSNHFNYIEHRKLAGKTVAAHGLEEEQLPAAEGIEWHSGDFQLGDAVIFHAHTIHKALPNLTENRMRLSIDNRYQRGGEAIEQSSMGTHYNL